MKYEVITTIPPHFYLNIQGSKTNHAEKFSVRFIKNIISIYGNWYTW